MTEDAAPATDGDSDRVRIPTPIRSAQRSRARSTVLREGVSSFVERRPPRFAPLGPFPD